jgi:hypothetical protein
MHGASSSRTSLPGALYPYGSSNSIEPGFADASRTGVSISAFPAFLKADATCTSGGRHVVEGLIWPASFGDAFLPSIALERMTIEPLALVVAAAAVPRAAESPGASAPWAGDLGHLKGDFVAVSLSETQYSWRIGANRVMLVSNGSTA